MHIELSVRKDATILTDEMVTIPEPSLQLPYLSIKPRIVNDHDGTRPDVVEMDLSIVAVASLGAFSLASHALNIGLVEVRI